jgi:membrane-associated HD superfamily phosphohydrolase
LYAATHWSCIFVKKFNRMAKWLQKCVVGLVSSLLFIGTVSAQCSICTKTAQQLGKASAQGLNSGIVYLMLAPFAIAGYIGYRWWKQEKAAAEE